MQLFEGSRATAGERKLKTARRCTQNYHAQWESRVAGTFENVCEPINHDQWEERSRYMNELVFPGYCGATSGIEKRLIENEVKQRESHEPTMQKVIRQVTPYDKSVSI